MLGVGVARRRTSPGRIDGSFAAERARAVPTSKGPVAVADQAVEKHCFAGASRSLRFSNHIT